MRDTQRERVYRALRKPPQGRRFGSVQSMQRYVDALRKRGIAVSAGPILVKDGRGRRRPIACRTWGGPQVRMPRWARSEMILLHEVAHLLSWNTAAHDARYCAVWLDLTERAMGEEAALELWRLFDKHRVKY